MYDKTIDDESRAFAEEIIADLKRDGWTFKKSDKDDPDYEAIMKKDLDSYQKLLDTGIVDMLLKM
ncbi:MAG: hypothetical protein IJS81_01700 [Selenomonadaceae bacterium]|nr:hypothetical protein [Selenomonadaceae bacterium]MBQ7628920.1 hypothetical protein [Selenomonadaceae bacterium]